MKFKFKPDRQRALLSTLLQRKAVCELGGKPLRTNPSLHLLHFMRKLHLCMIQHETLSAEMSGLGVAHDKVVINRTKGSKPYGVLVPDPDRRPNFSMNASHDGNIHRRTAIV